MYMQYNNHMHLHTCMCSDTHACGTNTVVQTQWATHSGTNTAVQARMHTFT